MKRDQLHVTLLQRNIAIADTLIFMLRQARASLGDRTWGALARNQIEAARSVLIDYGDAPYSRARCHELLVDVLDQSERCEESIEMRARIVLLRLSEALPETEIDFDTVRDAVLFWPLKRRRAARSNAVRELARALDCDTPSLMTMLRQARARIRARRCGPARRK